MQVTFRKPTPESLRTVAGVTFTAEEIAEINADLAEIEAEAAREQAELEWFAMMDRGMEF